MRLIDADNLQLNLRVPSRNNAIVKAFENSVIDALKKQPTVKAIPVEWIKNYASHKASKDLIDCYWHFWEDDVLKMVADWEKKNGKDSE